MGTPTLCIEIMSKSTRSKDMINKLNIYRLSGVKGSGLLTLKRKQSCFMALKIMRLMNILALVLETA